MELNVQISVISNDKSLITIFIKDRPVIWEAHSVNKNVTDENTGKAAIRYDVKAISLLRLLLDKYTDATDHTTMGEALPRLKSALGVDEFNAAMSLVQFTKSVAKNMAERKYENRYGKNYFL